MVRFLPTAVCGVLCNVVFALVVPYLPGWFLLAFGAAGTGISALLFAVLTKTASYWAFAFPATVSRNGNTTEVSPSSPSDIVPPSLQTLSVLGADFIYATSTI